MAIARVVVNTALRKLGVLAAGREPRLSDATDTLAALQGLYTSWIVNGSFGRLEDVVPKGPSYTPCGSCRVVRQSSATLDVILPELVGRGWVYDYGWYRCSGEYNPTVPPRDGMTVVISDSIGGETASWIYDGTVKQWQQIETLTLNDEAPRSASDLLGLSACLAIEVADQFGEEVSATSALQAARYKTALVSRYGMRRETAYTPEVHF